MNLTAALNYQEKRRQIPPALYNARRLKEGRKRRGNRRPRNQEPIQNHQHIVMSQLQNPNIETVDSRIIERRNSSYHPKTTPSNSELDSETVRRTGSCESK